MNAPLDIDPIGARRETTAAGAGASAPGVAELSPKRRIELDAIFGADGLLAHALDGYRPRAAQI